MLLHLLTCVHTGLEQNFYGLGGVGVLLLYILLQQLLQLVVQLLPEDLEGVVAPAVPGDGEVLVPVTWRLSSAGES